MLCIAILAILSSSTTTVRSKMRTLSNITLYDLMAEDLDVYVSKSKDWGYTLEIDNEESDTIICEEGIDPAAMDSFADFCKRYLAFYEKQKGEN